MEVTPRFPGLRFGSSVSFTTSTSFDICHLVVVGRGEGVEMGERALDEVFRVVGICEVGRRETYG